MLDAAELVTRETHRAAYYPQRGQEHGAVASRQLLPRLCADTHIEPAQLAFL